MASAKLDITTLKPGDVIEGRYKFIEKIGKGAFGTVLLMEDTVVEERLILKFLNANVSSDEEMMKRFVHELRYSRKITHKNVIRIYDFLYIRGNYAISMEYFPSHTLGGEIINEKPVELKRAVKFGIDIATGMAVAHQAGIVHRDLKPANVLIDSQGLLKIVDFGVAAAQTQADTQLTKTGYVIGSPKYMAPEQILGKKVDERADIYSLGVILYELFTGVPPYSRGDHMSVMYQHVQGKARPPIEINKALPVDLNNLVLKCMALDKAKRAQSMDELRLCSGEVPLDPSVTACRSVPLRRSSRIWRLAGFIRLITRKSNRLRVVCRVMARIDAFLKLGVAQGCSDLHLAVGVPPMLRMYGDLVPIKFRDLGEAELEGYITEVLNPSQIKVLRDGNDLDFSYVSAEGGRFRVNVFRKETGIGAAFRSIPTNMPSIDQLGLPPIVRKLCDYHQGMILVTGSTGTGKTTTLASMIDYLNSTRPLNIISLEDPIEFVHRSKSAQVIQRELGTHLPSFAEGVRAAMREDPDVILVGEMRDAETISMAMTAAETGHLVLGTLHTTSATKTIDRIVDALPTEEREQTKSFLASSLLAVITQVLVKTPDQRGRRAVCEIMVVTKAIGKLIMTDQGHQIPSQLQMGKEYGMQLMDQALLAAIQAKEVDPEQAYGYAVDKRQFQRYVTDMSSAIPVEPTGT